MADVPLSIQFIIRSDVLTGIVPLHAKFGRDITIHQVFQLAFAFRQAHHEVVRYPHWISVAWRVFDWTEPIAKLFWELVSYFSGKESDDGLLHELPITHFILFLFIHLQLSAHKYMNQKNNTFIDVWPGNEPLVQAQPQPNFFRLVTPASSSPSGSTNVPIAPATITSVPGSSLSKRPPAMQNPPLRGSPINSATLVSSRSPRFLIQNEVNGEPKVTFLREHMVDILQLISSNSSATSQKCAKSSSDAEKKVDFVINLDDLSSLSLLFDVKDEKDQKVPVTSTFFAHLSNDGTISPEAISKFICDRMLWDNELFPPLTAPNVPNIVPEKSMKERRQENLQILKESSSNVSDNTEDEKSDQKRNETKFLPPIVHRNASRVTIIVTEKESKSLYRDLFIYNCNESEIHIATPVRNAYVFGCQDSVITIGAVRGIVKVMGCEKLKLATCCRRLVWNTCIESTCFVYTPNSPLIVGDNRVCYLAPFNAHYPNLFSHLQQAGIPPTSPPAFNLWNYPIDLSIIGNPSFAALSPLASPSHLKSKTENETGSSSDQSKSGPKTTDQQNNNQKSNDEVSGDENTADGYDRTCINLLPPERFYPIFVPIQSQFSVNTSTIDQLGKNSRNRDGEIENLNENTILYPKEYAEVIENRLKTYERLQSIANNPDLTDEQKKIISDAISSSFMQWLVSTENLRKILDLIRSERSTSEQSFN